MKLPDWARRLLPVCLALLAAAGVTIVVTSSDDNGDGRIDRRTVEIRIPAKIADVAVQQAGAPAAAEQQIPGVSEGGEQAIREQNTDVPGTYDTSRVLEGAAAQPAHWKCYTPMNGGQRAISDIKLGIVHVTVSRNIGGTGDVQGLCSFFQRVKASATWIVDNEGNSAENVPLGRVPWTQAWYNRPSCSIEFVGSTGRPKEGPAEWTPVQIVEGARLMAGCFKLAGIVVQRAAVDAAGHILKAGVATHQELGLLGGGHTDPGEKFPMAYFMAQLRSFAGAASPVDKVTCRKLNAWRTSGRPRGGPWERRSVLRKRALTARGVTCLAAGPVRAPA